MVKNDFDIDVKVKCLEGRVTQAQLAEMVGTSAPYISRLINKKDGIVNKVFVEMLEKLGYDIQITYALRGVAHHKLPVTLKEKRFSRLRHIMPA